MVRQSPRARENPSNSRLSRLAHPLQDGTSSGSADAADDFNNHGEDRMDIQAKITSLAGLGATWVMWLLVGLSIAGMAVALERALVLVWRRENLTKLKAEVVGLLRLGRMGEARARVARSRSFEAQVVASGLDDPDASIAAVEERLAAGAQVAKLRMERRLAFLGTLGSNAPFLGLLGTVIGIVRAFHELNGAAGRVTSGLMSEVGEALVATAVGILVALPAIASFNYFQRMIKGRLTGADVFGKEVLAVLKDRAAAPRGESRDVRTAA